MPVEHWGAKRSQNNADAVSDASALHAIQNALSDQVQEGAMCDSIKGSPCGQLRPRHIHAGGSMCTKQNRCRLPAAHPLH